MVRLFLALLAAALLAGCTSLPPAPKTAAEPDYRYVIGPGDTLNIVVWRNPELSTSVPVRPDGRITTQVRIFGNYTVMIDTVPPTIKNVDMKADMKGRTEFNLKVQDDLSGIATWKTSMDGEWILMEYEPKLKQLTHKFDKYSSAAGAKKFTIEVIDDRGNTAYWAMDITR